MPGLSMYLIISCMALGVLSGFAAGLLGVGGGAIMVPVLSVLFLDIAPQHNLHLALATSLATIIFTSLASIRAHHARGAVLWPVVGKIAPGILLGTFFAARIAAHLPKTFLAIFFAIFISFVATQMLRNFRPNPSRQLPNRYWLSGVGTIIGGISALVAIGGGSLSVPFMIWCNVEVRKAIATSAAIGFPIALAGSLGYLVAGINTPGLPQGSLGFIYLPVLLILAATSMLAAPLGARAAHTLPADVVKKIFAVLLVGLAINMLYRLA